MEYQSNESKMFIRVELNLNELYEIQRALTKSRRRAQNRLDYEKARGRSTSVKSKQKAIITIANASEQINNAYQELFEQWQEGKENEYGIPSIATHTYRVPTDILEKRLEDGHLPLTVYMISYLHKIGIYTVIDLLNFPIIELKLMPDMDNDRYERLKASLTKINSYFSEDETPVFRALREC